MLDRNLNCRCSCCVLQLLVVGGESSAHGHRDTDWDGCSECWRGELSGDEDSPSCAVENSAPSSPIVPECDWSAVCCDRISIRQIFRWGLKPPQHLWLISEAPIIFSVCNHDNNNNNNPATVLLQSISRLFCTSNLFRMSPYGDTSICI